MTDQATDGGTRIALVATLRNEGPFVLEWLAYHRLIGFTEVWVASNDCEDGSPELLDALAARGLLTHVRCAPPPEEKAQIFAYQAIGARLEEDWPDWLMTIDGDEFLDIHVGAGRVSDLIAAVGDATAVMINWRVFGSAGERHWSGDSVMRRFTRAAPRHHGVNRPFKTLFRGPAAYQAPLLPHGPGYARDEAVAGIRPVDGGGRALPERFAWSNEFLQREVDEIDWSLAQVNHYNTRSWEDYLAKHARGGGQGPWRWDRDGNWPIFDRNEEEDLTIARHLAATEAAVAEMLTDPAVAAAHARCLALYGEHVAQLAAAA
jgi:hypothetical protein